MVRRGHRRLSVGLAIAALATLVGSCGSPTPRSTRALASPQYPVVVASFNFPESVLVAEIYADALDAVGIPVRRELGLGPRELVQPALQAGLIDVVPEYLGTALAGLRPNAMVDRSNRDAVRQALSTALSSWGVEVLEPASAQNQNALVVRADTAERLGLRTVSDLRRAAGGLRLGGPPECPTRPYCIKGFETTYGLHFEAFVPLDTGAQRATALEDHLVDVAVMFTTDPQLASPQLVTLVDDARLQPVENVTPVVSSRAITYQGAKLVSALDAVAARLTTESLRFLNWRVVEDRKSPEDEARGWLQRQGLLERRS